MLGDRFMPRRGVPFVLAALIADDQRLKERRLARAVMEVEANKHGAHLAPSQIRFCDDAAVASGLVVPLGPGSQVGVYDSTVGVKNVERRWIVDGHLNNTGLALGHSEAGSRLL